MVNNVFRTPGLICLGVLTVFGFGADAALWPCTLIRRWMPVSFCLCLAIATCGPSLGFWGSMTRIGRRWINGAIHIVVVTAILSGAFFAVNYFGTWNAPMKEEKAAVKRLYSETHYKTRRVSRKVYVRDTDHPYQVYKMDIELPGGDERPVSVGRNSRRGVAVGDSVTVHIRTGLLGVPVIDLRRIDYPAVRTRKPKVRRVAGR